MRLPLSRAESVLLAGCGALLLLALLAPPLAQPPHLHELADARTFWGLPRALDVLSNLPFAVAGMVGLRTLARTPAGAVAPAERACATLFFLGLLATALCSSWYHRAPDDAGLAVDRLGMGIAFAGLSGLVACACVSARAGRTLAIAVTIVAPASIAVWSFSGNVLPWAIVQFGAMPLLIAAIFMAPRNGALRVRWAVVLLAYAVAKWLEAGDHAVWVASGQLFSGHTLKHVAAALAAWPVIAAVAGRAGMENGRSAAVPAA
jgi:hypothetical protein